MAGPDFLNSTVYAFYYQQDTGMTDVNTIITSVRTILVTNLGWSEPTTARFKSPPDAAGKFIDVLLTRVTATNIEFLMRDYRGATVYDRRIQIDATAAVNYFCTIHSFVVESLRATSEIAQGALLDVVPSSINEIDNRCVGTAFRNTSDTNDGSGSGVGGLFAFDSGTATFTNRGVQQSQEISGTSIVQQTGASTIIYRDYLQAITQAGTIRVSGRWPQALIGDSTIAFSSDKTVPIDDGGSTGVFRCVGLTTVGNGRLLLRKS